MLSANAGAAEPSTGGVNVTVAPTAGGAAPPARFLSALTLSANEDVAGIVIDGTPAHGISASAFASLAGVPASAVTGMTISGSGFTTMTLTGAQVTAGQGSLGGQAVFLPDYNLGAGNEVGVATSTGNADGQTKRDQPPIGATLNVTITTDAPIHPLTISAPSGVAATRPAAFSAQPSDGSGVAVSSWSWSFDGRPVGTPGQGASSTHAFPAAGVWTVSVTAVTSPDNGVAFGSTTVQVGAPVATRARPPRSGTDSRPHGSSGGAIGGDNGAAGGGNGRVTGATTGPARGHGRASGSGAAGGAGGAGNGTDGNGQTSAGGGSPGAGGNTLAPPAPATPPVTRPAAAPPSTPATPAQPPTPPPPASAPATRAVPSRARSHTAVPPSSGQNQPPPAKNGTGSGAEQDVSGVLLASAGQSAGALAAGHSDVSLPRTAAAIRPGGGGAPPVPWWVFGVLAALGSVGLGVAREAGVLPTRRLPRS
ncbi:MAG TPA: PKD domain-containing protein [Conexibacter sp.]